MLFYFHSSSISKITYVQKCSVYCNVMKKTITAIKNVTKTKQIDSCWLLALRRLWNATLNLIYLLWNTQYICPYLFCIIFQYLLKDDIYFHFIYLPFKPHYLGDRWGDSSDFCREIHILSKGSFQEWLPNKEDILNCKPCDRNDVSEMTAIPSQNKDALCLVF